MSLFSANPLSLSVPEPAFETWLRDTGYLEILDECATAAQSAAPHSSSSLASAASVTGPSTSNAAPASRKCKGAVRDIGYFVISYARTFFSVVTINPFAKLTVEDFSRETSPWTIGFVGASGPSSYSWPAGPTQARMRVQENVKRYARNYSFLALLIFACSLYQMPKSLLGLVTCLVLWESLRLCSSRWGLEERLPTFRSLLVHTAQMATTFVLFYCNLHSAVLCALIITYTVMITHASLRKLSLPKESFGVKQYKKVTLPKKLRG